MKEKNIHVGYLPTQLAHSGRPIEVATELANHGIHVNMLGQTQGFHQFDRSVRDRLHPNFIYTDSPDLEFNPRQIKESESIPQDLVDKVVRLAEQLQQQNPTCVLSDHVVPLNIAARIIQEPNLISITNTSNILCTDTKFLSQTSDPLRKKNPRIQGRTSSTNSRMVSKSIQTISRKGISRRTTKPISLNGIGRHHSTRRLTSPCTR